MTTVETTRGTTPRRPTTLGEAGPALLALCLAVLVEMIDNSVLNVALPTIGRDLASGTTGLQWIVGAYSLTFGGLLLVGGSLGDRLGRRRVLLWGLIGFGVCGALTLMVRSTAELIAVRALSGAFAALIAPGTMSLAMRLFDDSAMRRKAIGVIVSVAMVGFAIGPVLAGLAVTHLPWQVLLVVNAPVALIAYLGVRHGIPADDPTDLRAGGSDVPGALLSVATLGLGLYAVTLGVEHGWTAPITLTCLAVALASGLGFIKRERSVADPMLDLALFMRPTVRGSALLQTSSMVAMAGVAFASTQIFQFAWGWSPLRAGLAQLPMVAGMFLAAPLVDKVIESHGHRRAAGLGASLLVTSLIVLIIAMGHGYPPFAAGMLLLTVGMRMVMTTCAVELIDALPSTHTGLGSALNDTAQELGNAIGVAVLGTIIATAIGVALPTGAWSAQLSADFIAALRIAFAALAGLVLLMAVIGTRTLSDAKTTEEH